MYNRFADLLKDNKVIDKPSKQVHRKKHTRNNYKIHQKYHQDTLKQDFKFDKSYEQVEDINNVYIQYYKIIIFIHYSHNYKDNIIDCLESIENQNYNNYHYDIIIVNDGVKDITNIEKFISNKKNFIILHHQVNKGHLECKRTFFNYIQDKQQQYTGNDIILLLCNNYYLNNKNVLSIINNTYIENKRWMSYFNFHNDKQENNQENNQEDIQEDIQRIKTFKLSLYAYIDIDKV